MSIQNLGGRGIATKKPRKQSRLLIPKSLRKQFKTTEKRFENLLKDKELSNTLRNYVYVMQKQMDKYAGEDLNKLKTFLKSEKKVFEKFRKHIRKFVDNSEKELGKVLSEAQWRINKSSNKKIKTVVPRSAAKAKNAVQEKENKQAV